MKQFTFNALSTTWYIEIYDEINDNLFKDLEKITLQICSEFENNYSRFKPFSLLSKLNYERNLSNPSFEFIDIITKSAYYYEITDHNFNIFAGTILEKNGYGESMNDETFDIINTNPSNIIINTGLITLNCNGNIDFGGIGKGYLIKKLETYFTKTFNLKYFLINGGGDIFVTSYFEEPIKLYLENPKVTGVYLGEIYAKNESLCASSPFKRTWVCSDKKYTHILDLKTNHNIINSSFVICKNVIDADIWATMCCIMDIDVLFEKSKLYNFSFKIT